MWAVQRSYDLGNAKILLPLYAITGIVSLARAVEPEEAGQPVRTKFSLQHFQGITLELLIGHVFRTSYSSLPVVQQRAALLANRSSVVRRNFCDTGFGAAQM